MVERLTPAEDRLIEAHATLSAALGRPPTAAELAEPLGVTDSTVTNRIKSIRAKGVPVATGAPTGRPPKAK